MQPLARRKRRMRGNADQQARRFDHGGLDALERIGPGQQEADVELALHDRVGLVGRPFLDQRQAAFPGGGAKIGQDAREDPEQRRLDKTDAQPADLAMRRPPRNALDKVDLTQRDPGFACEGLAGRCQRDARAAAIDQLEAQPRLEPPDRLAERRLGDAEPGGGAPEMQFVGQADEVTNLDQLHAGNLSRAIAAQQHSRRFVSRPPGPGFSASRRTCARSRR